MTHWTTYVPASGPERAGAGQAWHNARGAMSFRAPPAP